MLVNLKILCCDFCPKQRTVETCWFTDSLSFYMLKSNEFMFCGHIGKLVGFYVAVDS